MAYQKKQISKEKIESIQKLIHVFSKTSPIPGFAYYLLLPNASLYLKKALFEKEVLFEKGENTENFPHDLGDDLQGTKKQTLFIILNSGKTFKYDFKDKNIETLIKQNFCGYEISEISTIVIVTKYEFKLFIPNIIWEQHVSILVFDIPNDGD